MNIVFVGAGYVGVPTAAILAKHNKAHRFTVVDINEDKISQWKNCMAQLGTAPIYEPHLEETLKRLDNLDFSTECNIHIRTADIIFICVDTPTKSYGVGAYKASDTSAIQKVASDIREYSKGCIVVEKSTVPVHTAQIISEILNAGDSKRFEVLSNPEFMAEGTAIQDLESPSRVLIGGNHVESIEKLVSLYTSFVEFEKICVTSQWSSELTKLFSNAMLAQRVSSINSITALCEKTGANVREVAKATAMDPRIGNKFLNASIGFGGSCFKKDILNLVYLLHNYGCEEEARYWESVVRVNDNQVHRIRNKIVNEMFGSIKRKKIAFLGFSFKADTGDIRESQQLKLIELLLKEEASVVAYDPEATLPKNLSGEISQVDTPQEACRGASAVIIATDWDCFNYGTNTLEMMYSELYSPAFLFNLTTKLHYKHNKLKVFNLGESNG